MRSTKLRWKVLAGILCAALVFQSVPMQAVAGEAAQTVQSYDSGENNNTTEEETQRDWIEADSALVSSEDVAGDRPDDTVDVPETPDMTNGTDTVEVTETPDTTEMPDASEMPADIGTPDVTGTPDTAESGETAGVSDPGTEENTAGESAAEVLETETCSTEEIETAETLETTETEETEQGIALLADEWPDYKRLLSVIMENKYYFYEDGTNKVEEIFVKLENCEIPDSDILIKFYVDGNLVRTMKGEDRDKDKNQDYYVIPLKDQNISEGSHKLAVELIDDKVGSPTNGETLVKREDIEFSIEKADNVFTEVEKYYASSADDTIEVAFFNPENDIESVRITASNGDIVARSAGKSAAVPQNEDPRYTGIGDGYVYSGNILYKTTWVLPTEKNSLEVGNYDIRLTLVNGTERMIPDAVEVSSGAVITKCVLGMDYDNTSGFVYLYIQGTGFDPSRLQYDFKDEQTGATLSATRDSYKKVQSGYIVKLIKGGAWNDAGKEIKVIISKRPGSGAGDISFTQSEFDAELVSGIYYAEYNSVLNAVEVGVTTDLNEKAVRFSIVDDIESPTKEITVTSRSLTESIAYLTPDESLAAGRYYVKLVAGGKEYHKEFEMNQAAPSTNHWEAPEVISKNAERHEFYYYAVEAGIDNDGLKALIDGYSGDVAVYADEWLREDGAKGTRIQIWIPTQKLSLGQHTVRITRNGNAFSSHTFEIIASDYDKFVLDSYSLSWIDDKTIQMYIKTPNCAETDDYDIRLTDANDREASGISAVVTDRYADSVFMNITGLDKDSAFKDYYVLITHKKYGLPVKISDMSQKYYTDEDKGERTPISSNKGLPVLADNRIIGINIQNLALPATLTVYATDSTEVITTVTIPSTIEGNYYYFTKELYDSLEVKDRLYDLTLSDNGSKWGRSYARVNIGYKDETVKNDFELEITSDILYIDGAEGGRSAVISVIGNTQKPVFEVSDDEIVELEDYAETSDDTGTQTIDPNKKLVRAKNTGTTVITVIADGVEKSISVTVTRNATGITLNTSNRNMKVGDSFEAEAFIQPLSAEDPTQIVNFTSSDNNVLYVRKLTNTTANVVALRAGTAVLRATLTGTTYTVAVTISVTDSFPLYDKKEIKIKEVGTVSYIENVDVSLSDCILPEGWEWDNSDLSLTASDTLQYCWATYTEEGYQPFSARLPVAVTRIIGVDVSGKRLINQGQKENYKVTYEYVGADINTPKFKERITVNCVRTSQDNIAAPESLDWDNLVIAAMEGTGGGTADFTLSLAIDNGITQDIDLFTKNFSVDVPLTDCVNNIKVRPIKTNGQNFEYRENDDLMEVDESDIKISDNKYLVELRAEAFINGKTANNISFQWQSSDNAVASVEVNENGTVTLTVKKAGSAVITAVAEDQGQCTGTLTVDVMDYAPVLEISNVTVNKYSSSGAAFSLQDQNGNRITSVRVLEGDQESQNFSASVPVNGISRLRFKTNAPALGFIKKTVSNCDLEVRTSLGKVYKYALKVTTDVTKPSATVKLKTKANLFYTDAEAVYTISSKYDVASVEDITNEGIENAESVRFYGTYDRSSSTVHFNTKGTLNSSTLGQFTASRSPSLNVKLRITFAGYSEPQIAEVRIAAENKKPSLSMTEMVTCPGITSGTVSVLDSKTKAVIPMKNLSMELNIIKPVSSGISAGIQRDGKVALGYYGTKNVSYTAEIKNSDWTQPAAAKGKITYVKSPDKMSLALGSRKLTLNMATNRTANGMNTIPVSVNGSNIAIKKLTYAGTAAQLIDTAGYLACEAETNVQGAVNGISLGLNAGKRGSVKPGTYKLDLYATVTINEQDVTIKKATLTIKLTEAGTAKVAFASPKGKINLIDRANTSVVYTPKVSGIDSPIERVNVTGDSAEYFTASLNADNKVEIRAKAGRSMSTKDAYSVNIQSVLQNGYTILTSVKIRPVNTLPKIVFTPAKCNLYRSNSNKYTASVSLKNSSISLNNITGIKIDTSANKNTANNFSLVNNISKDGTVSFSLAGDKSRIKKGQYKVKCIVTFRDADPEAKPATVNMTINVK